MTDITNPQTSTTRIYEDGYVETQNAKIVGNLYAQEGKLGPLFADKYSGMGLTMDPGVDSESNPNDYYTSFRIADGALGYAMNYSTHSSTFSVGNGNHSSGTIFVDENGESFQAHSIGYHYGTKISLHMKHNNDSLTYYNLSAALTISGTQDASEDARGCQTFAIKCTAGMFAGLRPKVRTISAATTLDPTDHTILVDSTASFTITLPSQAEVGQEYLLLFGGSTYKQHTKVLACASPIIHCQLDDKWNVESLNLTSQGAVLIVYANDVNGDGRWWVTRLA